MAAPTLNENTFERMRERDAARNGLEAVPNQSWGADDVMTMNGFLGKSAILFILLAAAFTFTWDKVLSTPDSYGMPLALAGGLAAFVISIVLSFKPTLSPFLAPVFAVFEGFMLGAISALYETGGGIGQGYEGIVMQATLATGAIVVSMLILYRARIIKVTEKFRSIVMMAMFGVFIVYLMTFLLSLFGVGVPYIHDSGPIGIAFSVGVLIVASLMLLVDFDMVERGVATEAPKYMEWYGAFAIMVTVVWIYLEMLRLLAKMRR